MDEISSWHSYPKIHAFGHAAIKDLLIDEVIIQEKIDGSQFSFGMFDFGDGPELRCRSKHAQLNIIAPDKMFAKGVEYVQSIQHKLTLGWTFRGEYLAKPKHNTLAYDRVPENNIMIFDINTGQEEYMPYALVVLRAREIGLETVPLIRSKFMLNDVALLRELLEKDSVLGGQKVEGVVVKNYARFGKDGKALMGKFVSEKFKEVHGADWKERNPKQGDVVQLMIDKYRTPARWEKAYQHLRDAGKIEHTPRDIGMLIKEVPQDIRAELEDEIKAALFAWAWPKISRGLGAGMAEWYKEKLLERQFAE